MAAMAAMPVDIEFDPLAVADHGCGYPLDRQPQDLGSRRLVQRPTRPQPGDPRYGSSDAGTIGLAELTRCLIAKPTVVLAEAIEGLQRCLPVVLKGLCDKTVARIHLAVRPARRLGLLLGTRKTQPPLLVQTCPLSLGVGHRVNRQLGRQRR